MCKELVECSVGLLQWLGAARSTSDSLLDGDGRQAGVSRRGEGQPGDPSRVGGVADSDFLMPQWEDSRREEENISHAW